MSQTVMTPKFRVSFPSLHEQSKFGKYSITMIFDADEDLSKMKDLLRAVKFDKWGDKPPAYVRSPFRKGLPKTEENPNGFDPLRPEYEGKIIVVASSSDIRPAIRDANNNIVMDPGDIKNLIYAGCYARAVVSAFAYTGMDGNGKKVGPPGLSFNLQAVQKMYEGDRLSGVDVEKAAEEFTPIKPVAAGNHSDMLSTDDDI